MLKYIDASYRLIALIIGSVLAMCLTIPVSVAQQDDILEEITVTGSLIRRDNMSSNSPMVTLDNNYLELSGQSIITDVLREVPALVGSRAGNVTGDAAILGGRDEDSLSPLEGTASLNLRNLGESRTLVLVNGRRHVASIPGTSAVDINSIPTALVERVDVLTGGASAIYGADGVSGVVNFITKDDFEGLDLSVLTNIPDESGGENYLFGGTAGKNFANGRGNIAVNLEYFRQDKLRVAKRTGFNGQIEFADLNPEDTADGDDDANIPDSVFLKEHGIPFSAIEGVIFATPFDFSFTPDFLGTGKSFDPGIVLANGRTVGGDGLKTLFPVNSKIIDNQDRYTVNMLGHFDMSNSTRLYGEFKYVRSESVRDTGAASIDDFIPIAFDNAFIPAGITPSAVFSDSLGNPIPLIFLGRDDFDLGFNEIGGREIEDNRDMYRIVAGVEGEINDNLNYDLSYVFGRSKRKEHLFERLEDRFAAAVDAVIDPATGNIVCRSDLDPGSVDPASPFAPPSVVNFPALNDSFAAFVLNDSNTGQPKFNFFSRFNVNDFGSAGSFTPGPGSGCVPLNMFGFNQASTEAREFVTAPVTNESKLTQHVVSGVLTGNTADFYELPAGPIGFAVGFQYRDEKSSFSPDPLYFQNNVTFRVPDAATVGSFDVIEGFAEVQVPLIQDKPLIEDLSVGAAFRVSDYSTIGSTETWQGNGYWTVTSNIALRGSYSRAIRAPNMNELFAPQTVNFFNTGDPCLPAGRDEGTQFRLANCTADLAAVGIDINNYTLAATGPFQGTISGNADLGEESSDSFTIGAVLTPEFISGFTLAVDYWSIEISQGILRPGMNEVINQCYDSPTLTNQFCEVLRRSPGTGNFIAGAVRDVNIASFKSSGIDYEAVYDFELAELLGSDKHLGSMRANVRGTWLESLDLATTTGGTIDDEVGELGTLLGEETPEHVLNFDLTWEYEKFTFNYQYRWQSAVFRTEKADFAADPDTLFPRKTRSFQNHDISMSYNMNDNFTLFAGVNNLAKPSRDIGFLRRDRVIFAGINFSMDSLPGVGNLF